MDAPSLARSPRERAPESLSRMLWLARTLRERGRDLEAGALLLAFVEPEIRRRPPLADDTTTVLAAAAAAFDAASLPDVAAEVSRMGGPRADDPGAALCTRAFVADGASAAVDLVGAGWSPKERVATMVALGLTSAGAALADRLDLHAEAAKLWAQSGRFFESSRAWLAAREPSRAIEALTRLGHTDPRYRRSCAALARMADRQDYLDFEIDRFVAPFVASRPEDRVDEDAFLLLAGLYGRHGRGQEASRLVAAVRARSPGRPDLPAGRALPEALAPGLPAIQDFPDLPPLPDLGAPFGALPTPTLAPAAPGTAQPDGLSAGNTTSHWGLDVVPMPPSHTAPVLAPDPQLARRAALKPPAPPAWRAERGGTLRDASTPGAVIAGRYTVQAPLGEGAMGAVVRAHDDELGEVVALKVMLAPAHDATSTERLRSELRVTRRLSHPNVVRVHDIGAHGPLRYISMEYLQGHDLAKLMCGELSPDQIIDLITQAAEGLDAAHRAGVTHRDVKPANLFLTNAGTVKVMDFGIAREEQAKGVTRSGMIAGTAAYMAPEQAAGFSQAGPPADLYSLAIVAYEMCAGQPPFTHPETMPLLLKHQREMPPPISAPGGWVPASMEIEIMKGLSKNPADRHGSCAEFARALGDAWAVSAMLRA